MPLVPLMVNTKVPRGVLDLVLTVIVDVPLPFTDAGLKLAVVREGKPLTLIVNDGGTMRCNGASAKPISDPLLLQARALVTSLSKDAKRKLYLAPAPGSVFSYSLRLQEGTIMFADNARAGHPELAEAELFALRAAREVCGLSG